MAYTKNAREVLGQQPCLDVRNVVALQGCVIANLSWMSKTEEVGEALLEWLTPDRFSLDYDLWPANRLVSVKGWTEIQVAYVDSYTTDVRALLQCKCEELRERLYFCNDHWACRICHGLTYPSQRRSPQVRNTERLEELRARIGGGRPKGMHGRRYLDLLAEMKNLERTVKYHGERFASSDLLEEVYLSECKGSWGKAFVPAPYTSADLDVLERLPRTSLP